MSKPAFWATSDLHVRNYDRVWAERPRIVGDTSWALEQIAAAVEMTRVPLLLGGDNFEAKLQRADAIMSMRRFLDRVLQYTEIGYIDGNHELSDPTFMSSIHDGPIRLHKRMHEFNGVRVYGLDYVGPHEVASALRAVPETDVLLTHQVWKEFLGENRGEASMTDVLSAKLMITGDFHQHRLLQVNGMNVLSPGPVCLQAIDEEPQKNIYLVYDDLSITAVPLKSRPLYRHLVLDEEAADTRAATWSPQPGGEELPESVRMPIVWIHYPAEKLQIRAKLRAAWGEQAHLFFKPLTPADAPTQPVDVQRRQRAAEGGWAGVIREFFNEDPQAASIAIRMVEAVNPEEEVQRIYNELME